MLTGLVGAGTVFGGASSQGGVTAQQALSQIGPILENAVNLVPAMLTVGAAAGVRGLSGGAPGIGNNFKPMGARCDAALGKALQRSSGRTLIGNSTREPGMLRQAGSYLFHGERARTSGPASWT
ncbi:MAG: hypothetical protein L0Y71_21290, partial [Gemmataceae bacterium]|nr:hypothetical protein [Gemmataceae bacterium]